MQAAHKGNENKTLHATFNFPVYGAVSSAAWKTTAADSSAVASVSVTLRNHFSSFPSCHATPNYTHECGKVCDPLPFTEESNSFDNFPLPLVLIMRSLKFSMNMHNSSLPVRRGKEADSDLLGLKPWATLKRSPVHTITGFTHALLDLSHILPFIKNWVVFISINNHLTLVTQTWK